MITLTNVEYDKISGIITAVAEFEMVKYDIIIDTKTWEMLSLDDNIPGLVFSWCERKFKKMLSENKEITDVVVIAWY